MTTEKPADSVVADPPIKFGRLRYTTGFLVRRLNNLLASSWGTDIAAAAVRITPVQAGLLVLISENPDITQSRLIPVLDVESATLVKSISRLLELELVEKRQSRTDRRSFLLRLTEKGREVARIVEENMAARERRLSQPIDSEEYAIFLRVLNKLIATQSRSSNWQTD